MIKIKKSITKKDYTSENFLWVYKNEYTKNSDILKTLTDDRKINFLDSFDNYFKKAKEWGNLNKAINFLEKNNTKKVGIVGDYDVDGATSVSLCIKYLNRLGYKNIEYRIPQRLIEGYGINDVIVDEMAEKNVEILIVCDNGTNSKDIIQKASRLFKKIIVFDHHISSDSNVNDIRNVILVNPKHDFHHFDYLCTASLVFLAFSLKIKNDLLDLACLGVVCDMVPLIGLNFLIVKKGLPIIGENENIKVLYSMFNSEAPINLKSLGFMIGPCINAAGRIDDCSKGVRFLIETDKTNVLKYARDLYETNLERKSIGKNMNEIISSQISKFDKNVFINKNIIIVYNENYHIGLVGLLAGYLKEHYKKTAIVIGKDGKGSARSNNNFDVGRFLIDCEEKKIILKGGGHNLAGGLTLNKEKIKEFFLYTDEKTKNIEKPKLVADFLIDCEKYSISLEEIKNIEKLAPFGVGNEEASFILDNCSISNLKILKDAHLKGRISDFDFIIFNYKNSKIAEKINENKNKKVKVFAHIKINEFNSRETLQLSIIDLVVQ